MRLKNNQCIAYHEIPYGDFEALADTLSSLIDKCANSTFALLKICCTGSERKTELVRAYAEGKFTTNYLPTIGVDITTKNLNLSLSHLLSKIRNQQLPPQALTQSQVWAASCFS